MGALHAVAYCCTIIIFIRMHRSFIEESEIHFAQGYLRGMSSISEVKIATMRTNSCVKNNSETEADERKEKEKRIHIHIRIG